MSPIEVLLIIGGVGYVLGRRLLGQLLELKQLVVLPIVLTVVGALQLRHIHASATMVAFVAGSCLLSVGLGLARGRTVHLGVRNGELWMRYRLSSVGLWVLNIALKVAFVPLEQTISPSSATAADHAILLSIGLGILAETTVVLLRALHTEATVAWVKGEDGVPHQTLPAFEQARSWLRDNERPLVSMTKRVDRDW